VLQFVQFRHDLTGKNPQWFRFDSRLTSYEELSRLTELANQLHGFGQAKPKRVYRKFVETPGAVEIEPRRRIVAHFDRRAHNPILRAAQLDKDCPVTAADLVMTKPGGLTTSEALACGAALVIVNPIPGQESRNNDFLLENGAAIKVNNVATLSYELTQLLREPERIAQLKGNARKLGKPGAAFRIARAALDWGCETVSPGGPQRGRLP
jgi:hypothetical protein